MSIATDLALLFAKPIAHRGLHASGGPLENTIASAQAAAAAGYGIECDVRLTADEQVVVFHDATLDRLAGRPDLIEDWTAEALTAIRLHDGSAIPTLPNWLDAVAGRVPVVIEIKTDARRSPARIAAAIATAIAGRSGAIALESFDASVMAACAEIPCPIGLVGDNEGQLAALPQLPRCDFASWQLATIKGLCAIYPDLPRSAWTVRSQAEHARAREAGAQSVFESFRP